MGNRGESNPCPSGHSRMHCRCATVTMCARRDSNPQPSRSKRECSTNWHTSACGVRDSNSRCFLRTALQAVAFAARPTPRKNQKTRSGRLPDRAIRQISIESDSTQVLRSGRLRLCMGCDIDQSAHANARDIIPHGFRYSLSKRIDFMVLFRPAYWQADAILSNRARACQ